MEWFGETALPPKEAFYSRLTRKHISDEEYARAQTIWEKIGCGSFMDYHDIYLKTDVLLLADVFENFRDTAMTQYGLDPANFYTAPGLSWAAMLKMT